MYQAQGIRAPVLGTYVSLLLEKKMKTCWCTLSDQCQNGTLRLLFFFHLLTVVCIQISSHFLEFLDSLFTDEMVTEVPIQWPLDAQGLIIEYKSTVTSVKELVQSLNISLNINKPKPKSYRFSPKNIFKRIQILLKKHDQGDHIFLNDHDH